MSALRRMNLIIDGASVAVIAAAGSALLGWWNPIRSQDSAQLPQVQSVTGSDGLLTANVDRDALQQACAKVGLPAPPELRGVDVVPVRRLLQAIADWQEHRKAPSLGRMGQIYLALGLDRAALQSFAAAASLDPDSTLWTYLAGTCCQSLGEDRAARTLLEQARQRDPAYATTTARLATLALEQGELDHAAGLFEDYIARQSNSPLGYNGMGQVALARGQSDDAERWFERSAAAAPDDFRAWRLYGRALELNGKVEQSREAFARGESLTQYDGWSRFDPRLNDAHDVAGTQSSLEMAAQRDMRDPDPARAISALEALHNRRPSDLPTIGNLALAYHRSGQPDAALSLAHEAARRFPRSPLAHECVADVAFLLQRFDESLAAADTVIRLDPRRVRGHELRSRVLYSIGRRDEAIACLASAIDLDATRNDLRILQATLLVQAGRGIEADQILSEVLARDAGNREARSLLESIRSQRVKPTYGPG